MAYHDKHIEENRWKRADILNEVTDAAGDSCKIPRLQKALQEFDENFDVIGLVNFNWGHARVKSVNLDDRFHRDRVIPQSKSIIIKNKYALRYLAGQERMCRMSGMAQRITPQLLKLRSRDQDTHRVLKVALKPWPTLVGMKSLIEYTTEYKVGETYFRADWFCKYNHDSPQDQRVLDRASGSNDELLLCLSASRLCTSVRHQGHWPRSTQTWSLVHPVHCLVPHSLLCLQ